MATRKDGLTGLGAATAALAFLALLATFAWTLVDFRSDVERWARRDLRLRAELAAAALRKPLETQNIRRIAEIGRELKSSHGLLLTVYSVRGGVFYRGSEEGAGAADVREAAESGEYRVELGRPRASVFQPFHEALVGFALAALVGVVGMFAVFFALYRQRVRIRELARVETFRRTFIADVSHEIKTPLTGLLGAVDLLKDAVDADSPAARLAGMIGGASKRLNALVQEILDLARLEREGGRLSRAETDLASLVGDLAARYGVKGRTGGLRAYAYLCDPRLVEQALSNLVENARRHSGTTDITLALEPPAAPGDPVRLVVEDRGVGIPPEHLAQIFERFHRVDPARAAESGGAGLGLSIVRRIAHLHGGDVSCENVAPHGARFVLSLPPPPAPGPCRA